MRECTHVSINPTGALSVGRSYSDSWQRIINVRWRRAQRAVGKQQSLLWKCLRLQVQLTGWPVATLLKRCAVRRYDINRQQVSHCRFVTRCLYRLHSKTNIIILQYEFRFFVENKFRTVLLTIIVITLTKLWNMGMWHKWLILEKLIVDIKYRVISVTCKLEKRFHQRRLLYVKETL